MCQTPKYINKIRLGASEIEKEPHSGVLDGNKLISAPRNRMASFLPVSLGKKIFPRVRVGLETEGCYYQSSGGC